jgi:ferric-dicitrate binding protein FerR (iron transport regulator)
VGTQFDVYRKDSGTVVTVVEGRVAILSPLLNLAPSIEPPESGPPGIPRSSGSVAQSRTSANSAASDLSAGEGRGPAVATTAALSQDPNAVFLEAGEQLTVGARTAPHPTQTDTAQATAWTQHELAFDATPLNEVAREFNRYNTRQLVIVDATLRDMRITGEFSSTDPRSLLKFLRAQRDITVQETDQEIRITKK